MGKRRGKDAKIGVVAGDGSIAWKEAKKEKKDRWWRTMSLLETARLILFVLSAVFLVSSSVFGVFENWKAAANMLMLFGLSMFLCWAIEHKMRMELIDRFLYEDHADDPAA